MKNQVAIVLSVFLLIPCILPAQIRIEGYVFNKQGESLPGANVFLEGTYDGTSSNGEGFFSFETDETGNQNLVVRFIGYDEVIIPVTIEKEQVSVRIELKAAVNQIDMITITAGSFEAGGESKRTIFKEFDIVTTAGATGDITGVMNTMPGTIDNSSYPYQEQVFPIYVQRNKFQHRRVFRRIRTGTFLSIDPFNKGKTRPDTY